MNDPRQVMAENTISGVWKWPVAWMAVVADRVLGMSLNDWALLLAIFFTLLQIVVLVRDKFLGGKRRGFND